jgi:hypothetical protein
VRARSTILGFAVLTILLTAGAAQSLSGSNTVFTDDIVDNNVTNADLGTNSVTSSKVAPNSLTGSDINEASIPGFKKVLVAHVDADGDLLAGSDATASDDSSAGRYLVTFPLAVAACAKSVTVSEFPDANGQFFIGPTTSVSNATDNTNALQVNISAPNANPVASQFSLIVVCS